MDPIRKLLGFLQNHYRGRLYKMYIVNAPSCVYLPWQMFKRFMQEATVKKIQFIKQQAPTPLFEHANREQVEEKYGGSAPNLEKCWPFRIPSPNYFCNKEDSRHLVTEEEYIALYKAGQLEKHIVNMSIIEKYCPLLAEDLKLPQGLAKMASVSKDLTTNQTCQNSCDTSVVKSKYQNDVVLLTPEISSKVEFIFRPREKSCLSAFNDEYDYSEEIDEKNNIPNTVSRILVLKAYFLTKS